MNYDLIIGILIILPVLFMIWIIYSHNKEIKEGKIDQLRAFKSNINNALSLWDCLYIHKEMYKKGFTSNKPLSPGGIFKVNSLSNLSSTTVVFKGKTLEYIENHYESDSDAYKLALETYRLALSFGVDQELVKYNY